ncbi:MAG TPA: hypothetical protein VMB70_04775 [Terriglobia bacterium]|nr:hypothetical protein [Terriglobia bacterium]
MRSTVLSFVIASVLLLPVVCAAADINDIAGTWSGNWTPKGGILDAVTIEVRVEGGKVTGKFRTPSAMDFTKATFNPATGIVAIEATDAKAAGKLYKLDGKVTGNDLKGTLVVGGTPGDLLLIKWTYIPR